MGNTVEEERYIKGLKEAAEAFGLCGTLVRRERYGNGHINDTYLLEYIGSEDKAPSGYVLQRVNTRIFKEPSALMENIAGVTDYMSGLIKERGGDPHRETLSFFQAKGGNRYHIDSAGSFWRCCFFITDSVCFDAAESSGMFCDAGFALGDFVRLLSGYPAERLHETIPHFHNTPMRFAALEAAIEEDFVHRAKNAKQEIGFALERKKYGPVITDALSEGKLPLRVTHNDTKLNNILFDSATLKPLCIIDLDTVMPGSVLYDFGDAIRTGANTGAEDEGELSKVSLDLELYKAFSDGFLRGADGTLTPEEERMLPAGARLMTLECGVRFLTDYLQGDTYFKTAYDDHNLVRARAQFRLLEDMEKKI